MKLANFAKTIAAAAIAATSLTTSASAGYYPTNSWVQTQITCGQAQPIYVPTPHTRCYMEEVYDHYSGRYFVERRCNTDYR